MPRARTQPAVVQGQARLGKRTKHLVKRLGRGDIAVIDHRDLDRVSGEDLARCGVAAVINCAPSISGAYPNMGPVLLAEAGVPILEIVDLEALAAEGVHEFAFVGACLKLRGATDSHIRPIALPLRRR